MRPTLYDVTGLYLIVHTSPIQSYQEQLHEYIRRLRLARVFNAHVVFPVANSTDLHITISKSTSCENFRLEALPLSSSRGFNYDRLNYTIFNTLRNFNQCPLSVAVVETEPFVIVNRSTPVWSVTGIDVDILNMLSKRLNFRYKLVFPPENESRGLIYPNGTVTGAMGLVLDHKADITIGAYQLNSERSSLMQPSFVYLHTGLRFAIQPPQDLNSPLKHLIGPFKMDLWIFLGGMLVTGNLVIFGLKLSPPSFRRFMIGGHVNRTPTLNMWNVFLGNAIVFWNGQDRRALSTFAKTLFVIWSLGCLILRNSYQGSLYDDLRREDADTSLDTIWKIDSSNCDVHIVGYAAGQLKHYGIPQNSTRWLRR